MSLLIGDSHVRRFQQFLSTSNVDSMNINGLGALDFFGISGGSVRSVHHTQLLYSAVRDCRPHNVIVNLGSNDLDSSEDVDCIVLRLICFLTKLRSRFHLSNIVVLSFVKRYRTRNIPTHLYNERVQQANAALKHHATIAHIRFWKLRGFTNSAHNIFCDGVHLNPRGQYQFLRQIRGILLSFL